MKHARSDYNRIQDPQNLIPDGEPVFLLRGQDISAPETLVTWAKLNLINGGSPRLSMLALQHAEVMKEWQHRVNCKPAD